MLMDVKSHCADINGERLLHLPNCVNCGAPGRNLTRRIVLVIKGRPEAARNALCRGAFTAVNEGIGTAASGTATGTKPPVSRMASQTIRWFIFGVIIALAPLTCRMIISGFSGHYLTMIELCCGGELFLISSTMAATAVGRLVASGKTLGTLKYIIAGSTLFLLLISSFSYAFVTATVGSSRLIGANISSTSFVVFIMAAIASGSCVAVGEV